MTASSGSAASPHRGRSSAWCRARAHRLWLRSGSRGRRPSAPPARPRSRSTRATRPSINQYFTDVAHDSGLSTNVYSVATQYSDTSGAVQYKSTFGGSYVDKDPLPANGCDDGVDPYCLTDQQIAERDPDRHDRKGLARRPRPRVLPHDAERRRARVSMRSAPSARRMPSARTTTTSWTPTSRTSSTRTSRTWVRRGLHRDFPGDIQGFPNDVDSDTTINTISHEHNEAITDPLTDPDSLAWIAADGSENGDLCAYGFGTQTRDGRRRLQPGDQRPPLRLAAGVQQRRQRLRAAASVGRPRHRRQATAAGRSSTRVGR